MARWGLTPDGRPPSGAGVAFVRRGGAPLVLKSIAVGDEQRMAQVLRHWDGEGAVRVVEAEPGMLLMERATPGRELVELVRAGRDDEAVGIYCDVCARLERPAPASPDYPTVEDWGRGFARVRDRALAAGIEPGLIDHAAGLFADLCASQGPRQLLHGDLHHYNLVEDAERGWLAIDPKGVVGEGAYEAGALLRNPIEDQARFTAPPVAARRAAIIAERLGHDRGRILAWHFAQAVLSALWAVEDGHYAPAWLDVAHAARTLI